MSVTIHQNLKQYWGYSAFRPLQEGIINSVLQQHDTLALLPTGGGKSLCFQVPALAMEGICVVVSPLIALMKDQVEQLQRRRISAVGIYSGMHKREIDIALDNCVYGSVKFLYLSPERLQSELFLERVKRMKVCLLAVDEAHCISQWGYDFRPPYLQIAELRKLLPEVPVIALTATATAPVKQDIQDKLEFKNGKVFQKSFERANLSYSCLLVEDKVSKLADILRKVPGTAIVYVRSRRETSDLARFLNSQKIPAAAYHAGLLHAEREKVQENWLQDKVRVMVATNAFGMGIDKPDVRLVVHMEMPGNLEAYYQEAGRAGRDERYAYATLLYETKDAGTLRQKTLEAHPPMEVIRTVYQALANYYQLAVGSGAFTSFDFDLADFCKTYKLKAVEVHHAIKKLQNEGLVQLNEAFFSPSKVFIPVSNEDLYMFQVANANYDLLLKMLLRMYGGELFTNFLKISEKEMAAKLEMAEPQLRQMLQYLHRIGIIVYEPRHDAPQLVFTTPRSDAANLPLDIKKLNRFKEQAVKQTEAMIYYVETTNRCRTQMLLEYFDEFSHKPCRVCDFCLKERKKSEAAETEKKVRLQLADLLKKEPIHPKILMQQFSTGKSEVVISLVREMLETGEVQYDERGNLVWKK